MTWQIKHCWQNPVAKKNLLKQKFSLISQKFSELFIHVVRHSIYLFKDETPISLDTL